MSNAEDFAQHVARVRARFASTLNDKIAASFAELAPMAGGGDDDATAAVITAHRRLHEMYGVASTLGFVETGKAAGLARSTIREAAKAKRPPTPDEIAALKIELERLREAGAAELQELSIGGKLDAS
jgi:hypothetical protein